MLSLEKVQIELKRLSGEHDKLAMASSVSQAKDHIIKLLEIEKRLLLIEQKIKTEIDLLTAQETKGQISISGLLFKKKSKQDSPNQQKREEKLASWKEELLFANAIRSAVGQVAVPQLKRFIVQTEQETEKSVRYREYIQSTAWRKKAEEAKARAGNRCQICNKSRAEVQLEAHHRTYERLGNELPEDITVLCRDCHQLYEDKKQTDLSAKVCKKCGNSFVPLDDSHQFCANCYVEAKKQKDQKAGFCIRCQKKIDLNPSSPYCFSCFKVWEKYENKTYKEQVCHTCGEKNESTKLKPVCYKCYKKYRTQISKI